MLFQYLLIVLFHESLTINVDTEKEIFCAQYQECDERDKKPVCGIKSVVKSEGVRYHLRLFDNECDLIRFGCLVKNDSDAYGIINMEFCDRVATKTKKASSVQIESCNPNCSYADANTVCGLRQDGVGFKIRLFTNECELHRFNCENDVTFNQTDFHICNGLNLPESKKNPLQNKVENIYGNDNDDVGNDPLSDNLTNNEPLTDKKLTGQVGPLAQDHKITKLKHVIVVDGSMFDTNGDINDTIDNFFAATHVFDMPLRDIRPMVNESTRRMMVRIFGPAVVFQPWIRAPPPEKRLSDVWHEPTLASCFHKCPTKCPETYSPVCGVPGQRAREPSLMFRNHCYMDAAQCKMHWDDASSTSDSSAYVESSFLICLGDVLNGVYRFLPLIRTLQHMGRLKRKGKYHYKLRNMHNFNDLTYINPKLMG